MSGIVYYRLGPQNYWPYMVGYDYTKNASLVGSEIDGNFHYLEGFDIHSVESDGPKLKFNRVDGTFEEVSVSPYVPKCGISINDENEIGVRLAENSGISCFDDSLSIHAGCGLVVSPSEDSCDAFDAFLRTMLRTEGDNYISGTIPINGQYYGGLTAPRTECDHPCCKDDQFWNDYINSGALSLDVCGITCYNGVSRINTDNATLVLDDCQLKVNYDCGLTLTEPVEDIYKEWLCENWDRLEGTTGTVCTDYIGMVEAVNGQEYGNGGDWTNDQFYATFVNEEHWPKLSVDTYELGGLYCSENGLSVNYGCGLEINGLPEYEGFKTFMERMFPEAGTPDEEEWETSPYYEAYSNCLNSGVLQTSLGAGGGISCIGGSLFVNLGCGLEIEELNPCCDEDDEDDDSYYSYERFLTDHWTSLTNQTDVSAVDYMGGHTEVLGQFFGGDECSQSCQMCDTWMNDQFFCDYVSFILAGRIRLSDCQAASTATEE